MLIFDIEVLPGQSAAFSGLITLPIETRPVVQAEQHLSVREELWLQSTARSNGS